LNKIKLISLSQSNFSLDPNFITGLTESEGFFLIIKYKDNRAIFKITVGLRFKITMLSNETGLLKMIKSYFGCGYLLILISSRVEQNTSNILILVRI
jgi:hypothetical protein